MLYGGLLVTLFALFTGQKFVFECTVPYGLSLLYLALFGSVLAFGGYLTLLGRIGADGPVISRGDPDRGGGAVHVPRRLPLASGDRSGHRAVRARQCAGIAQKDVVRSGKRYPVAAFLRLECFKQVRFELQHGLRIGERGAGHDENVLGALAEVAILAVCRLTRSG